jgi:hypothetical protein
MPPILCFGLFVIVGALLVAAVVSSWLPGFAVGRIVMGGLISSFFLWTMWTARHESAERKRAFDRDQRGTATVVRWHGGVDTPLFVFLRVHGPGCEFDQLEQVTRDFTSPFDCTSQMDCPTGGVVEVVLGEPPCSRAYADLRGGASGRRAMIWISAIGALAGLVFVLSGVRYLSGRRKKI